jgi:4-hydroxy-4-methyl-2-oxoglutarate aldolase
MKNLVFIFLCCIGACSMLRGQPDTKVTDEYLLNLYKDLRLADVSDGMDIVVLRDGGLLSQNIEALWKDIDSFHHVIRGIALTARYVPTNRVVKNPMNEEEYKQWESNWYNTISSEPFVDSLKKGSVVVLDVQGYGDCGSVGSYNALFWKSKDAVGVVSNGGIRDTDELMKEGIPVYLDISQRGRGIRPGRNEIESVNNNICSIKNSWCP